MNTAFKVSFYLRSNYFNKDGECPIMMRINLSGEIKNLGSTRIFTDPKLWSYKTNRIKGRSAEVLQSNMILDKLVLRLNEIYRKHENNSELSIDLISSEFLCKHQDCKKINQLIDAFIERSKKKIGISLSECTLHKHILIKRDFNDFLISQYNRKDLDLTEINPNVIEDFFLFLTTIKKFAHNTSIKKLKIFKSIILYGFKRGFLRYDPFVSSTFHLEKVDRGYLTDDEIYRIIQKEFTIQRLDIVRDIFIFSCFTGLAYIDVANLTSDNIVILDNKEWIMTKRQKTSVESNILLLDIPKLIIDKYKNTNTKGGKLLPILSNQKMNSYLKEIADLCGIKKNLTFHLARHTFATMTLSKGVPMESVSKMLGHTNIKTTQIYARITNKKIEQDMEMLAMKLGKFDNILTNNLKAE